LFKNGSTLRSAEFTGEKEVIRGSCKTLESKEKSSFRASGALHRMVFGAKRDKDEVSDFCKNLIRLSFLVSF